MKIFNDIELIDLAIYTNKTLIVTDFHIGYEEALNKQGLLVPRFQFPEIIKRLNNIFKKLKSSKNSKNFLGHKKSQSDFFVNKTIDKIIVNGDIKHEFGTISEQEWRHTLKLLDYLGQHCKEVILIKGNHDTILGPIARKRNVEVVEHYLISPMVGSTIKTLPIINNPLKNSKGIFGELGNQRFPVSQTQENLRFSGPKKSKGFFRESKGFLRMPKNSSNFSSTLKKININNKIEKILKNKTINNKKQLKNNSLKKINSITTKKNKILVIHGNNIPNKELLKDVSTIIIGHEHPAVSIREGPRAELFKAYLIGKWKGKNLIVQPSFNLVTEGTDVLKEEVLSPFLKSGLGNFNSIVVADKLYNFGLVKHIQR